MSIVNCLRAKAAEGLIDPDKAERLVKSLQDLRAKGKVRDLRDDDFMYSSAGPEYSPSGPDPRESTTYLQRLEHRLNYSGFFDWFRGMNQAWQGLNLQIGQTSTFKKLNELWTAEINPTMRTIGESGDAGLPRQMNYDRWIADSHIQVQNMHTAITRATTNINEQLGDVVRDRLSRRKAWIENADGSPRYTFGAVTDEEIDHLLGWVMTIRRELKDKMSFEDAVEHVVNKRLAHLTDEQRGVVKLNLKAEKPHLYALFNTQGRLAKDSGVDVHDLIPEEDLEAGDVYFTRSHDPEQWAANHQAATELFEKELRAGNLQDEEMAEVIAEIDAAAKAEGQTVQEVAPELFDEAGEIIPFDQLADEVQAELGSWLADIRAGKIEEGLEKKAAEVEKDLNKRYKNAEGEVMGGPMEALAKAEAASDRVRKSIKNLHKKDGTPRKGKAKDIKRLEQKMFEADKHRNEMRKVVRELQVKIATRDGLMEELQKIRAQGGKKGAKAAQAGRGVARGEKQLSNLQKKMDDPNFREKMAERLDPTRIAKKIVSRLAAGSERGTGVDVMFDKDAGVASQMKALKLPMSKAAEEMNPLLNDVLDLSVMRITKQYMDSVASRNWFSHKYGTAEPMDVIKKILDEATEPEVVARRRHIERMFERQFKRKLGTASLDGTGKSRAVRWFSANMRNMNVPTYLGSSMLMLPGDVSLLHMAGEVPEMQRMGKQVAYLFSGGVGGAKKFSQNLAAMGENRRLALMMSVHQSADHAHRSARIAQIDPSEQPIGLGVPGSRIYKYTSNMTRMTQKLAESMFIINGFNRWNRNMDWGFRELFMADLLEFSKKGWDDLPTARRQRLLAEGIGEKEWKRIQKMHRAENLQEVDALGGKLTQVNFDKLSPEDFRMYKIAIDSYASRGIIHPSFGDIPAWADDPVGAMIFQFQGFGFAAQQKLIRVMMQKGIKDPLVLQSLLAMFSMGILFNGVRAYTKGEGEEWIESWGTPEGVRDRIYETWARSPLAVASSLLFAETVASQLSPLGIGPAPAKRQGGLTGALLGPTPSTLDSYARILPGLLSAAMNGDAGAAYKAISDAAPYHSHIGVRILETGLGGDE